MSPPCHFVDELLWCIYGRRGGMGLPGFASEWDRKDAAQELCRQGKPTAASNPSRHEPALHRSSLQPLKPQTIESIEVSIERTQRCAVFDCKCSQMRIAGEVAASADGQQ